MKKKISPFKINIDEAICLNLNIVDLNVTYLIILIKTKENETKISITDINTKEQFFYALLKTNLTNIYLVFINLTRQKKSIHELEFECLLFEFEIIQKLLKQW